MAEAKIEIKFNDGTTQCLSKSIQRKDNGSTDYDSLDKALGQLQHESNSMLTAVIEEKKLKAQNSPEKAATGDAEEEMEDDDDEDDDEDDGGNNEEGQPLKKKLKVKR